METFNIFTILFVFLINFNNISCGVIEKSIRPCDLNDRECFRNMLKTVKRLSTEGVAELDVYPFDPLKLKDTPIPLVGDSYFNITNTSLSGQSKCIYIDVEIVPEHRNGTLWLECTLLLNGTYETEISKPYLLGFKRSKPIKGSGQFLVFLYNARLLSHFHVKVVREQDGVIRMKPVDYDILYDVDMSHKVDIKLTGMRSGDEDISEEISEGFTKNWKLFAATAMNTFLSDEKHIIASPEMKILFNVPLSTFITGDLEQYLE